MRVCTTTKEPHSLYIGVAWCRHVNVAKFVTPPRTAVLGSRGGVTHSDETRLNLSVARLNNESSEGGFFLHFLG